jgi:hypothetical protein
MAKELEAKSFFINTEIEDVQRFDLSRFMLYDEDVFEPITANIFDGLRELPAGGQYTVNGKEARPDLVSFDIYGSTQYYWVIMVYNGLQSFNEIVHSQELTFPSLAVLEDFFFNLKVQQNESDRD